MPEKLYFIDRGVKEGTLLIRQNANDYNVDPEWVELMKEARDMGLSREQIRHFIKEVSIKNA